LAYFPIVRNNPDVSLLIADRDVAALHLIEAFNDVRVHTRIESMVFRD
jgi:hypothetical protein